MWHPTHRGWSRKEGACFRFLWLSAEKPQGAEQTFEGHYGNPYAPWYTGHLNKFHVNDNFHSAALKLCKNMNRNSFGMNIKQFYLLITAMNTMPSFKGLQAPMGRSIQPYRWIWMILLGNSICRSCLYSTSYSYTHVKIPQDYWRQTVVSVFKWAFAVVTVTSKNTQTSAVLLLVVLVTPGE